MRRLTETYYFRLVRLPFWVIFGRNLPLFGNRRNA